MRMDRATRKAMLEPMVRAAGLAAETMPPADRADVYDAIAHVMATADPTLARDARRYAESIRASESLQLRFKDFFRSDSGL